MPKAIWNNQVIAESDDTVIVDGNHYFPADSIRKQFFQTAEKTTVCGWKGTANYYDIVVDGETNSEAAWYYADPKPKAESIRGRVAFWKGVDVTETAGATEGDSHGEC